MQAATFIRWAALAAMTLSSAQADTLVQWGDIPSGAGTPGTNIVSANQIMVEFVSTYSGNTNNPPVGANYYPDSTGRSPLLGRRQQHDPVDVWWKTRRPATGWHLRRHHPGGGTFRGMVMWFSNDFLNGSTPVTFTSVTVSVIQRVNPDTTGQGLHIVVRQGDNYYLSDGAAFGSSLTTQTFALAARTWSAFTPFVAGTETIGSPVGTPTFNAVQAIGLATSLRKWRGGGRDLQGQHLRLRRGRHHIIRWPHLHVAGATGQFPAWPRQSHWGPLQRRHPG